MFAHIDVSNRRIKKRRRDYPRADDGEVQGLEPGTAVVPIKFDGPPPHDSRLQRAVPRTRVRPDEVVEGYVVEQRPPEELIPVIKQEAERVILTQFPEWKQRNALAVAIDLTRRGAQGRIDPADEKTERSLRAVWRWTEAVRAESDAKEAAVLAGQPIDLDDWPEYPA